MDQLLRIPPHPLHLGVEGKDRILAAHHLHRDELQGAGPSAVHPLSKSLLCVVHSAGWGGKDRLFPRLRNLLSSRPMTQAYISWSGPAVICTTGQGLCGPGDRAVEPAVSPREWASPRGDKMAVVGTCKLSGGGHARRWEPCAQRRTGVAAAGPGQRCCQCSRRGVVGTGPGRAFSRDGAGVLKTMLFARDHVPRTELWFTAE